MKKVGVIGNYGHNNLGDESILHGILEVLPKEQDIVVFTESIEKSKLEQCTFEKADFKVLRRPFLGKITNIPFIFFDIIKNLRALDVIVIGGGGLLNDSYRFVAFYYFFLGLISRLFGKKLIVAGISVGPLRTKQAKLFSKMFLKLAHVVIVRDEPSFKFSKSENRHSLKCPDLALAKKVDNSTQERGYIAVNVIPYNNPIVWFDKDEHKYQAYVDETKKILSYLINEKHENIKLFPIDFEFDKHAIEDIYNSLSEEEKASVSVAEINDVDSLVEVISGAKLMYGSRLHAAVLSVLCETPFISSAYQEKVSNFAAEVNNSENVIMLDELNALFVCQRAEAILNNQDIALNNAIKINQEVQTAILRAKELINSQI